MCLCRVRNPLQDSLVDFPGFLASPGFQQAFGQLQLSGQVIGPELEPGCQNRHGLVPLSIFEQERSPVVQPLEGPGVEFVRALVAERCRVGPVVQVQKHSQLSDGAGILGMLAGGGVSLLNLLLGFGRKLCDVELRYLG
jgi:hypothetical protein